MKKLDISVYKIKAGLEKKLTAAVISDIHGEEYSYILDEVKKRHPDMILIPGDVTNGHISEPLFVDSFFAACRETAPVFMSLGNHENHSYEYVKKYAVSNRITLLDDAFCRFGGINIGGLTSGFVGWNEAEHQGHFRRTPDPDLDFLRTFSDLDGFKLLLCHHPEYYPWHIRKTKVDLTISGHAHGGQWRIFGQPVFAPGQKFFPRYAQGFIENRLIVSRGLANNGPVPRFFNNRELIFIELE